MTTAYTTIALRGVSREAVGQVIGDLNLEANLLEVTGDFTVINLGGTTPTLDRFYQRQDEFREIAAALSRRLGAQALAAMNLDDELLLLWAFDQGELVFQYDSNPMILGCPVCSYSSETVSAEVGEVDRLAELLGVPGRARALKSWLGRKRGLGFLAESERHRQIARLLELPTAGVGGPQPLANP